MVNVFLSLVKSFYVYLCADNSIWAYGLCWGAAVWSCLSSDSFYCAVCKVQERDGMITLFIIGL